MLTIADGETIRLLLEDGLTQEQVAKRYGVSQGTISRFLSYHGIPHPEKRRPVYDHEHILQCRADGLTIEEAAKAVGCSVGRVANLWTKHIRAGTLRPRMDYLQPDEVEAIRAQARAGHDPAPLCASLYLLADNLLTTFSVNAHDRDDLRQEMVISALQVALSDIDLTGPFSFLTQAMIYRLRKQRSLEVAKRKSFERYCRENRSTIST